jgi:hypothetical protein
MQLFRLIRPDRTCPSLKTTLLVTKLPSEVVEARSPFGPRKTPPLWRRGRACDCNSIVLTAVEPISWDRILLPVNSKFIRLHELRQTLKDLKGMAACFYSKLLCSARDCANATKHLVLAFLLCTVYFVLLHVPVLNNLRSIPRFAIYTTVTYN